MMERTASSQFIMTAFLLVFVSLMVTPAIAGSVDLDLGPDAARFGYRHELQRFDPGAASIGGSLLYNEQDDFVAALGLMVTGNPFGRTDRLLIGAAIRAYGAVLDTKRDDKGLAGSLGVGAGYRFSQDVPVWIDAWVFLAPDVTSFSDIDGAREVDVRVGVDVTEGARIYAGYRFLEFERDRGKDREVDDALHAGVRLTF